MNNQRVFIGTLWKIRIDDQKSNIIVWSVLRLIVLIPKRDRVLIASVEDWLRSNRLCLGRSIMGTVVKIAHGKLYWFVYVRIWNFEVVDGRVVVFWGYLYRVAKD